MALIERPAALIRPRVCTATAIPGCSHQPRRSAPRSPSSWRARQPRCLRDRRSPGRLPKALARGLPLHVIRPKFRIRIHYPYPSSSLSLIDYSIANDLRAADSPTVVAKAEYCVHPTPRDNNWPCGDHTPVDQGCAQHRKDSGASMTDRRSRSQLSCLTHVVQC